MDNTLNPNTNENENIVEDTNPEVTSETETSTESETQAEWTDNDMVAEEAIKEAEKLKAVQKKLRENDKLPEDKKVPLTDEEKEYEEAAKAANKKEDTIKSIKDKIETAKKNNTDPVFTEEEEDFVDEAKREMERDNDPLASVNTAENYKDDKRMEGVDYKDDSISEALKGDSNFLWNTGNDPLVNFNFTLIVEAMYNLPCKAIKGIRRENDFEYIQEGGLNDYVHMKRKPISKPFTFQIERYVGFDLFDPIALGTELTLPILLFCNRYSYKLSPPRVYAFTGCVVTAKDYGDMEADKSGLMVETTTIAYRQMLCLDYPNSWIRENTWKLKDNSGDRHYMKAGTNDKWESNEMYSKKNMVASAKAHMYSIHDMVEVDPRTGQLKTSGRINQLLSGSRAASRRNKADMIKNADALGFDINDGDSNSAVIDPSTGLPKMSPRLKRVTGGGVDPNSTLSKAKMVEEGNKRTYNIDPDKPQLETPNAKGDGYSKLTKDEMIEAGEKRTYNINPDKPQLETPNAKPDRYSLFDKKLMTALADTNFFVINEKGKRGTGKSKRESIHSITDVASQLETKEKMVEQANKNVFLINKESDLAEGKQSKLNAKTTKGLKKATLVKNADKHLFVFNRMSKRGSGKMTLSSAHRNTDVPSKLINKQQMEDASNKNVFLINDKSAFAAGKSNKSSARINIGLLKATMEKQADEHLFVMNEGSSRGQGKSSLNSANHKTDVANKMGTKDEMLTASNKNVFLLNPKSPYASGKTSKTNARFTKGLVKATMVANADKRMFVFSIKGKRGSGIRSFESAHTDTGIKGKLLTKEQMVAVANKNVFPAKRNARDINKILKKK